MISNHDQTSDRAIATSKHKRTLPPTFSVYPSLFEMSNYTIDGVPSDIKNLHLKGALHIEILHAGRMVATGDEALDIVNARKDKNHIDPREMDPKDGTPTRQTIRISMNVENPAASCFQQGPIPRHP